LAIDINKCLETWINDGEPEIELEYERSNGTTPYPWASMLTHDENELCSTKAAYGIYASYHPEIVPDGISIDISSSLQRLFDTAIEKEKIISQAVKYCYPEAICNSRIEFIGRPDIIVNKEIIEIKYSAKSDIQYKWLYQVASYMRHFSFVTGQIVVWSRITNIITPHRVLKIGNNYVCENYSISDEDIDNAINKISKKLKDISDGKKPPPPFISPISLIDDFPVTSQCTYIKDGEPKMYLQCHGLSSSGERCKIETVDEFLCRYHRDQEILIDLEFCDPIIKTKRNCPWYTYCWKE
jgi:hypothetical protein